MHQNVNQLHINSVSMYILWIAFVSKSATQASWSSQETDFFSAFAVVLSFRFISIVVPSAVSVGRNVEYVMSPD